MTRAITDLDPTKVREAASYLYDAAEDAAEALALLRIGLLHDRHALKVIDTHLDELKYALAKARGDVA